MGIAEDYNLEADLRAGAKVKTVQLVNSPYQIQPGDWVGIGVSGDPNKTVQDLPHGDVIREKLRAGAKDEKASPEDRAAAKESLRIMYRETN
jgi:hypothetical protein